MIQIKRKCYNKPHKCANRVGSGWNHPKEYLCEGGMSGYVGDSWKFHTCSECGLVTWPEVVKWLDPTWLWWVWETIEMKWRYR